MHSRLEKKQSLRCGNDPDQTYLDYEKQLISTDDHEMKGNEDEKYFQLFSL